MKLNFEEIKSLTHGAVSVENTCGIYRFFRFNRAELDHYAPTSFMKKSYATAGITLECVTDATAVFMRGKIKQGSGRSYYAIDVLVDDKLISDIKNFKTEDMIPNYVDKEFEYDSFSEKIELGAGRKNLRIVFPWSAVVELYEMELIDAVYIEPVKKSKTMIIYGDSITQGYDAESPSRAYAVALAYALDAEAYNKAIGGEFFSPELSAIKNDVKPDYITVAYGTNDWSRKERDEFLNNSRKFYENLSKNYPEAKIFAISPIWRADSANITAVGEFGFVEETVKSIADSLPNVKFISGIDLVPKSPEYYGDLRLHPRNIGFDHYAKNLLAEIKKHTVD